MQQRRLSDPKLATDLRRNDAEIHIAMERLRAILALCKARVAS